MQYDNPWSGKDPFFMLYSSSFIWKRLIFMLQRNFFYLEKIKILGYIAFLVSGKYRFPYAIPPMLCQVRKLESQGFDAKQAITSAMTDVLNDCLQNVSDSFVSKSELQQVKNWMLSS